MELVRLLLAGVIVKLLVEAHPDKKILAIDADPSGRTFYSA